MVASHAAMSEAAAALRLILSDGAAGVDDGARMKPAPLLRHAAACLLLAASGAAPAAVFTVGNVAGCSAGTITAALALSAANGPDLDLIRVMSGTYAAQSIEIGAQSVYVIGGYVDCTETSPSGGETILSGAGNGGLPVVRVNVPGATRRLLALQNLTISGGSAAGLRAYGNMQFSVAGVTLIDNEGENGGGLHVSAENATDNAAVSLDRYNGRPTIVERNSAIRGGGVYVEDFGFVSIGDAIIANNTANFGGGVFGWGSGAQLGLVGWPGGAPGYGVRGNTALLDGGGVYLFDGARLTTTRFSNESPPPTIADNTARRNGGGLYLGGTGSFLLGYNVVISGNTAGATQNGNGGGLYLSAGTSALLEDGGDSTTCSAGSPCVAVTGNRAGLVGFTGNGGGAYLLGTAHLAAVRTHFSGNTASNGGGVYAIGNTGAARFVSSVLDRNGGDGHSFRADAGATLELRGSTLADDASTLGLIALGGGNALLETSIIHDPGAAIITRVPATTNHVTSRCVLAHAAYASESGSATVGNPLFVDAASGNYALQNASPAIDACADTPFIAGDTDYFERLRGTDMPGVSNGPGLYDLGALEWLPAVVLLDGFE
jgi:hypothetical protein